MTSYFGNSTVPSVIYAERYIGSLDGSDKTAAMANLLASANGDSAVIVFPGGDLVLSSTITLPPLVRLVGQQNWPTAASATSFFGNKPTRFWWNGVSSTTPMFAASFAQQFEGIHFMVKPTRTCYTAISVNTGPAGATPSGVTVRNCGFWGFNSFGGNATYGQGKMTYGCVIAEGIGSNAEEVQFYNCIFANFENSGIWLAGGQPYHTVVDNCFFGAYDRALIGDVNGTYGMWGSGVKIGAGSASAIITKCRFSRLEIAAHITADPAFVTIDNSDCEVLKKLVWCSSPGFNNGRTVTNIFNGRYDTFHGAKTANFPASDIALIDYQCGGPIAISGAIVAGDGTPIRIKVNEASVVHTSGFFNDPNPVIRVRRIGATKSGGTYLNHQYFSPDADINGSVARSVAITSGCENPEMNAIVSDGVTTVYFGFATEEVSTPNISFQETVTAGSPAAGTWSVVPGTATVNGFVAQRSAAPGTGNSVSVAAKLSLPYADPTPGSVVESSFATNTVMGTAVNAGPLPGAVDHWMIILISRLNLNAGTPGTICAYGPASGTGYMWLRTSGNGIAFSPDMINTVVIAEPAAPTIAPVRTDVFGIRYRASTNTYSLFRGDVGLLATGTYAWSAPSGQRFMVGRSNLAASNGYPASNVVLHAFSYGTGLITDDNFMQALQQSYSSNRTHTPTGGTEVTRYVFNGTGAATDLASGGTANISLVSGTAPGSVIVRKSWRK